MVAARTARTRTKKSLKRAPRLLECSHQALGPKSPRGRARRPWCLRYLAPCLGPSSAHACRCVWLSRPRACVSFHQLILLELPAPMPSGYQWPAGPPRHLLSAVMVSSSDPGRPVVHSLTNVGVVCGPGALLRAVSLLLAAAASFTLPQPCLSAMHTHAFRPCAPIHAAAGRCPDQNARGCCKRNPSGRNDNPWARLVRKGGRISARKGLLDVFQLLWAGPLGG